MNKDQKIELVIWGVIILAIFLPFLLIKIPVGITLAVLARMSIKARS